MIISWSGDLPIVTERNEKPKEKHGGRETERARSVMKNYRDFHLVVGEVGG
jgi:hypothetical protein